MCLNNCFYSNIYLITTQLPNGLLRNFGSIDCSILRITEANSNIFLSPLTSMIYVTGSW